MKGNEMTNTHLVDPEFDQHLRRTLHEVAAKVEDAPTVAPEKRRSRRRAMVGLGAAAVAVPLAAGAIMGIGSEYVDELPPGNVIVTGSIDGSRYWMVEAFHKDDCGKPFPGVELVIEDSNIVGQEWNTLGMSFGSFPVQGCSYDNSDWLADPSRWDISGTFLDESFVRMIAVHPLITAVRVTIDGSPQSVAVHRVDGAGYGIFEVPPDSTKYTVELLIDGEVVPGSRSTRAVPEPS